MLACAPLMQGSYFRRHFAHVFACRFGECGRQQKGECALVHDPSKVAVCTHWLAGSCSAGEKCKRQHKVSRPLPGYDSTLFL